MMNTVQVEILSSISNSDCESANSGYWLCSSDNLISLNGNYNSFISSSQISRNLVIGETSRLLQFFSK